MTDVSYTHSFSWGGEMYLVEVDNVDGEAWFSAKHGEDLIGDSNTHGCEKDFNSARLRAYGLILEFKKSFEAVQDEQKEK